MDSLSDRLKSLGVQLGGQGLKSEKRSFPIQSVMGGSGWSTPVGEAYYLEKRYLKASRHGESLLQLPEFYGLVAEWGGNPEINQAPPEGIAFLDTETTGLAGGSGTFAFLVGIGRFEGEEFRLRQFFLRDPSEEPALLTAVEAFLNPCEHLVTYNGKSFDYPLLQNRFISNGWVQVWEPRGHLDLLHLARRLWRDRFPSRSLGDMETQVLGVSRNEEEVPGWLVPQIYRDYLQSGDARPLEGVFYHNQMDILSLVGLLNHMAGLLAAPLEQEHIHPTERLAIARLLEDLGRVEEAYEMYERGLGEVLPAKLYRTAIRRYSFLCKRNHHHERAIELWKTAASMGEIYAFVEIAKYYEHQIRDLAEALAWTRQARARLVDSADSALLEAQWWEPLEHRRRRLERKLGFPPE